MAVFKPKFDTDQDYYAILGVSPHDPLERVKSAYRQLARQFHPDAGPGADPYKFDQAAKAWAVLSDPKKRRYYDRLWKKKHRSVAPSNQTSPSTPTKKTAPQTDWNARIRDICRRAEKQGPFKEEFLEELMGIQKRQGLNTLKARQEIIDHWLAGMKGLFGAQANLRDSYLSELIRLEKTYGVDAQWARTDVLDTWVLELKKMIMDQMTGQREIWPQIVRQSRDYGYDVKHSHPTDHHRRKKRPTFGEVLAERMR